MRNQLKDLIVRAAKRQGYTLAADWKMASLPLVQHLQVLFARHQIDCVIDVGGNLGQYHDLIRHDVQFQGPIVTFEPVAKYVSHLQGRARDDRAWKIMPFALGAQDGTATINVTSSPGLNSLLQPSSEVVKGFWTENSIESRETVQVRTLDGLLPALRSEFGFSRPYLKLDTQGFDLEALKGAPDSLPMMRALQTEAAVRALYQGMPTYREVLDFLVANGFELSGMFPVSVDDAMRLIEFDCVAVNRLFAE